MTRRADDIDPLKGGNGWQEYQRLVLHELKAHTDAIDALEQRNNKQDIQISVLQVKAGLWGALGGFVPAAIFLVLKFIGE